MKIGLVRDGGVLARTSAPAHSQQGLAPQLPALEAAWLELLAEAGLCRADFAGVAMAFPSLVDPAIGRVLAEYGKYADAPNLDLRALALAELDLPLGDCATGV